MPAASVRRAIVTGADSGIGRASAVALARAGCDVGITWHRDRDGARATADEVHEHGRRGEVAQLDLARSDEVARVVDELVERLGGLDVFVNNAGTAQRAAFIELALEDWRHVIDVDLTGPFLAAQAAARHLCAARRGGRVVNVTSVHEHVPLGSSAAYCAAKGGLGLLTKVMALELAEHGITVNSIAPGEIATPMTGAEDVDPRGERRPGIPMRRPGDAREIAAAVAFVASEEASYLTGHSFVVDGGMLLMAAQANQLALE